MALGWNSKTGYYEFRLSKDCPIKIAEHKMRNRNLCAIRKIAYLVSVDMARAQVAETRQSGVAKKAPDSVETLVAGLWAENRKAAI